MHKQEEGVTASPSAPVTPNNDTEEAAEAPVVGEPDVQCVIPVTDPIGKLRGHIAFLRTCERVGGDSRDFGDVATYLENLIPELLGKAALEPPPSPSYYELQMCWTPTANGCKPPPHRNCRVTVCEGESAWVEEEWMIDSNGHWVDKLGVPEMQRGCSVTAFFIQPKAPYWAYSKTEGEEE